MDLYFILEIVLFLVLLALSGFFSGSETALFSLSQIQIDRMGRDRHPAIGMIRSLLNEPRRLIVTILIGNELVNVSASVLSANMVIRVMGGEEKWWVNIFVMLPILLLVGEITPKTIAVKNSEAFSARISRPIQLFSKLITPLRIVVRWVADGLTTFLVGPARTQGSIVTEDMVRTLADQATEDGLLDGVESRFLHNIFDFGNLTVEKLMTPRANMFTLSLSMPPEELLREVKYAKFLRIPVYRKDPEDIKGILHVRDLLDPNRRNQEPDKAMFEELVRPSLFVPETKPAAELFHLFRQRKSSFALALDEFGAITGLITMEDLLQTIFGNISSMNPQEGNTPLLNQVGPICLDGALSIQEINEQVAVDLPADKAETLGGLLLHQFGELPGEGAMTTIGDWRFTIRRMKGRRITKVVCTPITEEETRANEKPPCDSQPALETVQADHGKEREKAKDGKKEKESGKEKATGKEAESAKVKESGKEKETGKVKKTGMVKESGEETGTGPENVHQEQEAAD